MEVLDIVQSAAFKAGIVPSFNVDDFPGDVHEAGRNALQNEILPSLNCDRMIDITVTSRIYVPKAGHIVLTPFKPEPNFVVVGRYAKPSTYIADNMLSILHDAFNIVISPWPTDDLGNDIKFGIWSSDNRLVWANHDTLDMMPENINIDFPPMRIDAVLEADSRIPYDYKYRDEYERVLGAPALPGIFTTEEYEDSIDILLKGSPAPKMVILPVPLQIINSDAMHSGTIVAPAKFRRYLIDCTAVALAIIYGVSTLPAMQQQASISYNLIKKNKPQPMHEANPALEIGNKLRRNVLGRRYYADI